MSQEPQVQLVIKSQGVGPYVDATGEEIIEYVARHGRERPEDKEPGALVRYLTSKKHWSPLEHLHFTFRIRTSRAMSAQFFRHRSLHHQEWSQRYDRPPGIEPIEFRLQAKKNRQSSTDSVGVTTVTSRGWRFTGDHDHPAYDAIRDASHALVLIDEAYDALIKAGIAKECARMILPMASTTIIHLTGNLRDWLAFCNVRLDEHAQLEARLIANQIAGLFEDELPGVFEKLEWRKGNFM